MIIHLKDTIREETALQLAKKMEASCFYNGKAFVLVNSSSKKDLPGSVLPYTAQFFNFDSDLQLASKKYLSTKRKVKIGNIEIGGDSNNTIVIGGPCSVEGQEQIELVAQTLKSLGLQTIRGGCFKPRTSPYSFQGMGFEGLELLAGVRNRHGLMVVTEVKDASHVNEVIEKADVIQIGAKAMYDQGILKACSRTTKPVMIKRGFGSTLQEFVQAAEFVLCGGNPNVILCERGIRTFENGTRFTLDLCGVAWLKEYCNLPIILDPSHALGYRYGISDLSKACVAMGVDGLLIETHPEPNKAKSDASQQIDLKAFETLVQEIKPIAKAVNKNIL